MDELATRTAVSVASGLILEPVKHVLDTWLKPRLEESKKKRVIDRKLETFVFEVFSDYLNRTYEEQNNINVIALGLQQIKVKQIYVPLTIYSKEKREEICIDKYKEDFSEQYKKVVVVDTAGMGKSTLMKTMFISAIEQNKGIPVFIELRNLTKEKDIIDVIVENISTLKETHSKDFLMEVINRGGFIFFLDGYDEIPFQYKQDVTRQLKRFISLAGNNIFYLTSRPDESLASFGEFQQYEIKDLKIEEAYNLIKKYDDVVQLNLYTSIIKQIDENITQQRFSELESFLGNPLLVSFLYLTFKHKKDIPALKIEFYRKVYDALFESHDLSKDSYKRDKYSGLSSGSMQKILIKLGFLCLRENVNDYDKNKMLKLIGQAKNSPYFKDIQEELIFKDLLETVPLFTSEGLSFKWAHKSFMEYFAAYFIDNQENREEILNNIYKSSNFSIYYNMLDFYYDIDRNLFDKVFVYPIIKKFLKYIYIHTTNPTENSLKLNYLETWFNKGMISYSGEDAKALLSPSDLMNWNKLGGVVGDRHSDQIPSINNYKIRKTVMGGKGQQIIFERDSKIEYVLRLLKNKRSSLIKGLNWNLFAYPKKNSFVSFYENLRLEEMDEDVLKLQLEAYAEATDGFAIDYLEALKYKELIEEEIQLKEEDLFKNL
ncbi:NACHT domain-containing protein [Bacillus cereus]|nr:NACHT domain-containing protein [Bacillus cereus]